MSHVVAEALGFEDAKEPPLVEGLPVIGNLLDFIRRPTRFYAETYRAYGEVHRIRVGPRTFVVLAGPEACRFFTRNERELFSMAPIFEEFNELFGARRSMISVDGDEHSRMRKHFKPTMSRRFMESKLGEAEALTRMTLEEQRAPSARRRGIDMMDLTRALVFHQLGPIMAGDAPVDYLANIADSMRLGLEVGVLHRWPKAVAKLPRYARSLRRVHELARDSLATDRASAEGAPDLRDAIRAALDVDLIGPEDITLLTLTPYNAGIDTVAGTMGFFLHALLDDRRWWERLRADVDEHWPRAGALDRAALRKMKLVEAAKSETMRRYPVTISSIREVMRDFVYAGFKVRKGETIMVPIAAAHFMHEFYDDVDTFDPTRFMDERAEQSRAPGVYNPYGIGPHTCLGAGLADALMCTTVATLLRYYDLERVDEDYALETAYVPLAAPVGLRVRVRPRDPAEFT